MYKELLNYIMNPAVYIPLIFVVIAIPITLIFFLLKREAKISHAVIHLSCFIVVCWLLGTFNLVQSWQSQTSYLILQISFFLLGVLHTWFLYKFQVWSRKDFFLAETLFTLIIAFLGGAGFLLVSHLIAGIPSSWVMAGAVLPFVFPFFLHKTLILWKVIPSKIYYVWQYLEYLEIPEVSQSEAIRVHFRIARDPDRNNFAKFTVRAPENMKFGDLFHYFLYDYNNEHAANKIIANTQENPFGWYFYTKSFLWKKKPIDPNLSVYRNELKDNILINARRIHLDY